MRHTFVVYVEDKPGVLNRVASLFRRRAFNIESLTVGHTEMVGVSRITILVKSDAHDITSAAAVYRELAMVKVETKTADIRTQVIQLVDVFRARVIDVAPDSVIIETTGTEEKIEGLLEVLRPYGLLELVRTGRVGMVRGPRSVVIEPPQLSRPERTSSTDDEDVSYSV